MARLTDPELLARYHQALAEWKVEGYIEFLGRARVGLATLEGVTVECFKEALYRFVCQENGEIDQVKEEREPWRNQWEWHYDLRPTIKGVKLYVETRLIPESFGRPTDSRIQVVQIKLA